MTRGNRGVVAALVALGLTMLAAQPASAHDDDAAGPAATSHRGVPKLPGGGREVFAKNRFLLAYYGTAGTSSLGVLGETDPDTAFRRIKRAGKPFVGKRERLQPVYELIVTVADGAPGTDGDYSHDILFSRVQEYIDAAHRHGALLLLDLQPGRDDFTTVAKRWKWALEDPWVGLALDPEWRTRGDLVPGQALGSVTSKEVDKTSAWLARLVRKNALPEKLFVLHQFTSGMVKGARQVKRRRGLAMVQHVDGFGTPAQKIATYRSLALPGRFTMGFKLFYDEDQPRMRPRAVRRIRPAVRFVSFQ